MCIVRIFNHCVLFRKYSRIAVDYAKNCKGYKNRVIAMRQGYNYTRMNRQRKGLNSNRMANVIIFAAIFTMLSFSMIKVISTFYLIDLDDGKNIGQISTNLT